MSADRISVVIVDFNAGERLLACLSSIRDQAGVAVEVVVIQNGDVPPAAVQELGARLIQPGRNLGFAAGANAGIAATHRDWVALVNPDTSLPPNTLASLIAFLKARPGSAAVSPILRWPTGHAQPYWFGSDPGPLVLLRRLFSRVNRRVCNWEETRARPVDWVSGACLVARRAAFAAVGPLDERFFLYFEDADWCRRCRVAGWAIWIEPSVPVSHQSRPDYGDVTRRRLYRDSLRRYYVKYYPGLANLILRVALASLVS